MIFLLARPAQVCSTRHTPPLLRIYSASRSRGGAGSSLCSGAHCSENCALPRMCRCVYTRKRACVCASPRVGCSRRKEFGRRRHTWRAVCIIYTAYGGSEKARILRGSIRGPARAPCRVRPLLFCAQTDFAAYSGAGGVGRPIAVLFPTSRVNFIRPAAVSEAARPREYRCGLDRYARLGCPRENASRVVVGFSRDFGLFFGRSSSAAVATSLKACLCSTRRGGAACATYIVAASFH